MSCFAPLGSVSTPKWALDTPVPADGVDDPGTGGQIPKHFVVSQGLEVEVADVNE